MLHLRTVIIAYHKSRIYTSAPFKFIIDGNPLYIHAELISQNSKPLDRMINGHMSEAKQGFAVIKDVDEDTFVRFIQWAYNGYYDAGEFKIRSPQPDSAPLEGEIVGEPCLEELDPAPYPEESYEKELDPASYPEESYEEERVLETAWGGMYASKGKKDKRREKKAIGAVHPYAGAPASSKRRMKESFINRQRTVRQQAISICPPRPNQASNEDYAEVFLSHARMYVFAEEYDIQSLKALALDELHGTLQNFNLYPERTEDIVALLRYVYANTGEPVDGVEDMRTVLAHYVGFEMDTLLGDKKFGDLMIEDGGALLGDFLKMVKQRL